MEETMKLAITAAVITTLLAGATGDPILFGSLGFLGVIIGLAYMQRPRGIAVAWQQALAHCRLSEAVSSGRIEQTDVGFDIPLRIGLGASFATLERQRDALAASIGCHDIRFSRDTHSAGHGVAQLVMRDHLADVGTLQWPWLAAGNNVPSSSLWNPVPLGIGEDGNTISVTLPERSILIGGIPGSGKGSAQAILVAAAALDPDALLFLIDGKGGMELGAWEPVAERLAVSIEEANSVLEHVRKLMDDRQAALRQQGLRVVQHGTPLIVVVIDELAAYANHRNKTAQEDFTALLQSLVSLGRAEGVVVLASTQKPASEIIPTNLRDLIGIRLAMRCTNPDQSDTILGKGHAGQGFSASRIRPDKDSRGEGLLLADDSIPQRIKCFYLDDDAIRRLVSNASQKREPQR
jgi:hypothetical protein